MLLSASTQRKQVVITHYTMRRFVPAGSGVLVCVLLNVLIALYIFVPLPFLHRLAEILLALSLLNYAVRRRERIIRIEANTDSISLFRRGNKKYAHLIFSHAQLAFAYDRHHLRIVSDKWTICLRRKKYDHIDELIRLLEDSPAERKRLGQIPLEDSFWEWVGRMPHRDYWPYV